jgi:glutamate-1-semialdehyde 2,1-aminomutase
LSETRSKRVIASTATEDTILSQYLTRTPRSRALAREASRVIPGGIVTDTRAFEPYGIYVEEAAGTRKWDVDGHEYLDFFGGHGANMLGHAPRVVVDAVQRAVGRGVQYAANGPLEVHLAQTVARLMPSAERVRFTGSGTEATLLAIRLARAHTGRSKLVRFAGHYHGWHDHAISGYIAEFDGTAAAGVLPGIAEQTLLLPAGDIEALNRTVETYGKQIAAFLVEPVGSHFGIVPLAPQFLHAVQDAARGVDAVFVLDEVLSGFRVALGGAQSIYDLTPDLTTLAKVLCGGMPGGAVVGRAEIMDLLDFNDQRRAGRPKVSHQGTFTGNPVSMAAGIAMLGEIESSDACTRTNALGTTARAKLNAAAKADRLPFLWYGDFSAFHLMITREEESFAEPFDPYAVERERYLARPQPILNRLRMALNVNGVDVNTRCSGLLSAVHTEGDIDGLTLAVARAADMLRRARILAA